MSYMSAPQPPQTSSMLGSQKHAATSVRRRPLLSHYNAIAIAESRLFVRVLARLDDFSLTNAKRSAR